MFVFLYFFMLSGFLGLQEQNTERQRMDLFIFSQVLLLFPLAAVQPLKYYTSLPLFSECLQGAVLNSNTETQYYSTDNVLWVLWDHDIIII